MQAADAAIRELRALMVPPERLHPERMLLHILGVLALALMPLAVVVAGECLFPRVPAQTAAPAAAQPSLEAEIRARTGLSPDFVYDLSSEAERAAGEKAAAAANAIAADLAAQKTYRLRVHFLAGLAVLLALALTVFVAQVRIVRQHTDIIEENVLGPGNRRSADDCRLRFRRRFGGCLIAFALAAWAAAALAPDIAPATSGWLQTALRVAAALIAGAAAFGLAGLILQGVRATLLGAGVLLAAVWIADSTLGLGVLAASTARLDAAARAETATVAAVFAVTVVLAAIAAADRLAGSGLLRRHALAPLTAAALVLGGMATAEVLSGLTLPGQPRLAVFLAELGLPARAILASVAALAALIVATTAVTLHGNLTFARNYPDTDAVEVFAARHNILTRNDPDARQPDAVWKDLRDRAKTHPPEGDGAPVRISLTPKQIEAAIRALTLTLAVVMVVALVVLSLGFDLLEAALPDRQNAGAPAPTALRDAFGLSLDAVVILLGLGFSVALSAAYVLPMLRIAPHAGAEAALADASPSATAQLARLIAGGATFVAANGRLTPLRPGELSPADPDPEEARVEAYLARWIGADATKFRVLCHAWIYGAAFHSILDDTLAGKLKQTLTLLAPALAGTLLGLVG